MVIVDKVDIVDRVDRVEFVDIIDSIDNIDSIDSIDLIYASSSRSATHLRIAANVFAHTPEFVISFRNIPYK